MRRFRKMSTKPRPSVRLRLEQLEDRVVPAISLIQSASASVGPLGSSAASATVDFSSATTAGDLVVADITYEEGNTLSVPSGWTTLSSQSTGSTAMAIAYDYDCGSFSSATFSTSSGGLQNFVNVVASEFSGVMATRNPLDVNPQNSGSGTSLSSGTTSTTAQPNELVLAGFGLASINGPAPGHSFSNSFTALPTSGLSLPADTIMPAYLVTTSAAAQSTAITAASSTGWLGTVVTFEGDPVVSSVSPSAGPTAGGTSVTITGYDFRRR